MLIYSYEQQTEFIINALTPCIERSVLYDTIEYLKKKYNPADIFDFDKLDDWARENEFVPASDFDERAKEYENEILKLKIFLDGVIQSALNK
jgi:hypothetical protein